MQRGEASLTHGTSISRESLILLHLLLLQAFVYPDHGLAEKVTFGAHVRASVFNWNETCFLNRSSELEKSTSSYCRGLAGEEQEQPRSSQFYHECAT